MADKKNIFLKNTIQEFPFSGDPKNIQRKYPKRNVKSHAEFIQNRIMQSYASEKTQKQVAAIRYKEGTYLEFSGAAYQDLETKSLENRKQGIRLLNVREDAETHATKAIVYIPSGKESYFINKFEDYATKETSNNNPRYNNLCSSIENVKLAMLESFWIGDKDSMPKSNPTWCEIWLRFDYDKNNEESWKDAELDFMDVCHSLRIEVNYEQILFPERIVKLAKANAEQLKSLISSCDYITELRRAQEVTAFYSDLTNVEQREWIDELLSRISYTDENVTICLLDTGLTDGHPLLENAIQVNGMHSVNTEWGIGDHGSHGTEMAGLALYNDLRNAMSYSSHITIRHKLESVKVLPPRRENKPELYGFITEQAVALPEISNPNIKRVLCMAVTSEIHNTKDGSPTSWSATVDKITSAADDEGERRLFFVSAGNIQPFELEEISYPDSNILHGVESPGQAWNAITVGAYSKDIILSDESFDGYSPVADFGELSPYSATSQTWDKKWPIKPEVLFDGGNMATNGFDFTEAPDLSLLTTYYRPLIKQFSTIWGTSSATAQASWMGAQLIAEYPNAWPETIRALIIHSATWTNKMKQQFCCDDSKSAGRRKLLKTCGYGIPDLQKAIQCMNNNVNLVIEGELQPFENTKMKDMHMHELPWPKELLQSLGEVPVTLKVTLSYFIEPGPGEVGWKDKYRYPSCNLRFDVINSNQTKEDFLKRVNAEMRNGDKKDKGDGTTGSERWYLGSDNRNVGSIHSDYYEANAVDLCDINQIAIYPVVGWWRERSYLGKSNSLMRYSLVVSLSTPDVNIDLYTPIITKIKTSNDIEVSSKRKIRRR